MKTCTGKRTEDAAADRVKNKDSSSARAYDGPTSLTSFGMIAKPLAPLSRIICETKKTGKYSSATNCRVNFNQLAAPFRRKVIQTKSRQTLVFDPGGC